jgi:predicted rRNA methylase YqxC with S4 and FtsJ domains
LLVRVGLASSMAEAKRFINDGAIKINEQRLFSKDSTINVAKAKKYYCSAANFIFYMFAEKRLPMLSAVRSIFDARFDWL